MLRKITLFLLTTLCALSSVVSFALNPLQIGESMAPVQQAILRHDPYISTLRVPPPPELTLQQQGLMAQQATISIN